MLDRPVLVSQIVSVTYLLELLNQRIIDLAVHRGENTLLGESSIQNLLDSNRARDANWDQLAKVQVLFIRV